MVKVAENIYQMDVNLWGVPGWGSSYLLVEGRQSALVDTGTAASVGLILDGIREVGVKPEDIAYIILTHTHLDHSGGAGLLLRDMPRAQVIVHPRGAKHVISPERSLQGILEARPGGDATVQAAGVVPLDAARVRTVSGGEKIELAKGQALEFRDAPGHAPHDLFIHETRNNGLFTGDAAGTYMPQVDRITPASVPPTYDFDQYVSTVEMVRDMRPSRIYFGHFGMTADVLRLMNDLLSELKRIDALFRGAGGDLEGPVRQLKAETLARFEGLDRNSPLYRLLTGPTFDTNMMGLVKYYRDRLAA